MKIEFTCSIGQFCKELWEIRVDRGIEKDPPRIPSRGEVEDQMQEEVAKSSLRLRRRELRRLRPTAFGTGLGAALREQEKKS